MSDEESKLSAYMTAHSVMSRNCTLFAGFTFTAITILITRVPDPSTWQSQAMLFFLAAIFYELLSSLFSNEALLFYCVKFAPKLPPVHSSTMYVWQFRLTWPMLGSSVWLLFLLWNLPYLALATGIMFVLFIIVSYRSGIALSKNRKPYQRISLYEADD